MRVGPLAPSELSIIDAKMANPQRAGDPFQECFEVSDDVSNELDASSGKPIVIHTERASAGTLVELLVLKRSVGSQVSLRERTPRGDLLRGLLRSTRVFRCTDAFGVFHAKSSKLSDDFADEAQRRMSIAGVPGVGAVRLAGALHELLVNIEEHAGSEATSLGAFEIGQGEAWIVVGDTGHGVLAGYHNSDLAVIPTDAEEALTWAVVEHKSRLSIKGRGTGFQTVLSAVRSLDGAIRVRSDTASLELEQAGSQSEFLVREQGQLAGFVVSFRVRW